MNWQSFITLIQEPSESSFFVSNTRNHDQIGKTLCGLLNTNGGILVIGYDKVNVHLTGYNESDEWINQFITEHFNGTLSITSAFLFRSNKKVLILEVIKSEQIQNYDGDFFHINNRQIEIFEPQKNPTYNFNVSSLNIAQAQTAIQTISKKEPLIHELPIKNTSAEDKKTDSSLNERQIEALEYVKTNKSIKNKDYRKLFGVSHKTAHIELVELVHSNNLKQSGSGRSTCYITSTDTSLDKPTNKSKDILDNLFNTKKHITESIYAEELNMDLAQAIHELQQHCESGNLEKTIINNDVCYTKGKQLSFI